MDPHTSSLCPGDVNHDGEGPAPNKAHLGKTEISLTLHNKLEVPDEEISDARGLMIRTKRMIVDVIRCQLSGDTLTDVLELTATEQEVGET